MADKFSPYMDFVTVGQVNKKMVEKFKPTHFPSMMVLVDPTNVQSAEFYNGEDLKKENMVEFLSQYTKNVVSEFEEFSEDLLKNSEYCKSNDNKFCLIFNL